MLSDFRLNVKKDCKVILSEGVKDSSSKYCKPDVCVEEEAICMKYKLVNVLNCAQDLRKVSILPIKNLDHGTGLLADSNYVYAFFIEKEYKYLHWPYCGCFDLEKLSDRCLLFDLLMSWFIKHLTHQEISKKWDELYAMAQKWNQDGNKNPQNNSSGRSLDRTTNPLISPTTNSTINTSTPKIQQQKREMLKKLVKDRF
ncbi:hypothetical protein FDP41_002494 [Naegleria fowleri]|uniref:Uncharacterized protein n=1 Tax=Naegleria fowleri TaxID=5763 RepID=A0A6A5BWJ1_NAEFO|nr:uncharacterized protein FDP41_002494 [Naegleria fowleri]KAF0978674.1 hypothetical protein FDP41_002494 [Naegleria fowleri]